jgi:Leucine-rich repeat (LRR) protein
LIASFNKITSLPPQIGKLKRLRRLLLNSNKLKHIPDDLGQLDMLEELVLSENSIEDIPVSMSLMSNLKTLKLANNKLKAIPYEIADILTLELIDCSNNHNLESIPPNWRGDTDSVIFTCRIHRGKANNEQIGCSVYRSMGKCCTVLQTNLFNTYRITLTANAAALDALLPLPS